jgi:hypothetical protein
MATEACTAIPPPAAVPGVFRLSLELRQIIYNYIFSDAGDKTLTITLTQDEQLRTHNGSTIFNLILSHRRFLDEVLNYLFKDVTIVLYDRERTCRPIVTALHKRMGKVNTKRIGRIAIPYLTIRDFLDPANLAQPRQLDEIALTRSGAIFKPYVKAHMVPDDNYNMVFIQGVLRKELECTMDKIGRLPSLTHLELGIDVLEFMIYQNSRDMSCALRWAETLQSNTGFHSMLNVVRQLRAAPKLAEMHVRLRWSEFVEEGYRAAGVVFDEFTDVAKEKVRDLYVKYIAAVIQERGNAMEVVDVRT